MPSSSLALAALCGLAQANLVFAVNEGVTYRVPNDEIRARYAAIAADLCKLLKQPVQIEPVADYPSAAQGPGRQGLRPGDGAPGAPVDPGHEEVGLQAGGRDQGLPGLQRQLPGQADSPFKSLADLKGRKLGAPDEDSITSWMVRATLRDALGDANQVTYVYTRYQDAVPFFVENNLTPAGATASSAVIKAWQAKGGKVLAKSKAVPIKHVIASPTLHARAGREGA